MKYEVIQRDCCRICKSGDTEEFLRLKDMPFTDDFIKPKEAGTEFIYDIAIYFCKDCHTVQTQHDVVVNEYYEDYQYSVGASKFAYDFMNGIAEAVMNKYFHDQEDVKVLEVGSGDGEQLVAFKNRGCKVLGYEPSSFLVDIAEQKSISSVQGLFDKDSVETLPEEFKESDVIFLSYTFDHIPDPIPFVETAKKVLSKERGLLIIENHDLEKIFDRQEYCLFEHEHSIYLTKETAWTLADNNGFDLIEFDVLPEEKRRANSLIFIMTPKGSVFSKYKVERPSYDKYNDLNFYKEQANLIFSGIKNIDEYLTNNHNNNKSIAGYGCGGRGIMTLSATNKFSYIKYLVDKKPKTDNIVSPKTHLPVYKIEKLESDKVDSVIVFSFGYMKEIREDLLKMGYESNQLVSMLDILKGNY